MMNKATNYAHVLRSLARFSQCAENRTAFLRAAELIEQLAEENAQLRSKHDRLLNGAIAADVTVA